MPLASSLYQNEVQLKLGAKDLFEKLKQMDILLGIATSCTGHLYFPCLNKYHLHLLFSAIAQTDLIGKTKDYPDIYCKLIDFWHLEPNEIIVIDDVGAAIQTAKSLGCRTIAVLDEHTLTEWALLNKIADISIHDFRELLI